MDGACGARRGKIPRLAQALRRYGEPIERDFADRGHDLAALLRDGRYRMVDNVIRGLPRDSHYVCAVSEDEELAAQADLPAGSRHPRMTDWSPEVERLTNIEDLLRIQIAQLAAQLSRKQQKPPKPSPRPVTAWQRAAQLKRYEQHRALVARVLPHREGSPPKE